jgi:hypothetical protein
MDRRQELVLEAEQLLKVARQKEVEAEKAREAYYNKVAELFRLRDHEKSAP